MAIKYLGDHKASPWRVYWRNPFTKKIETRHFSEKDEAEKHDSLVKHWLKHDPEQLRPEDDPAPATVTTVYSLVMAHIKAKNFKPKSLRETSYHVAPILAKIGAIPISDLKKSHMREVVAALRESGLKANTINRKVAIVKAALNWAEEMEMIEVNPIRAFSCPRGTDTQIPPPTTHELEAMLSVAMPHIQRVIILGLSFGIRIGQSELFRVEWSNVDMNRWMLFVASADKNLRAQWRDLKIKESLRGIILRWKEDDDAARAKAVKKHGEEGAPPYRHVINWHGHPVGSIKRAWKETLLAAGITRRIRPYDLRHAHATEAIAAGADVKAVSENMGHSDTTMIYRHYQHVLVKQRESALEAVPNLVIQSGNTEGHILADFCITEATKPQ